MSAFRDARAALEVRRDRLAAEVAVEREEVVAMAAIVAAEEQHRATLKSRLRRDRLGDWLVPLAFLLFGITFCGAIALAWHHCGSNSAWRSAQVVTASNRADLPVGERCEVVFAGETSDDRCEARVTCGESHVTVYDGRGRCPSRHDEIVDGDATPIDGTPGFLLYNWGRSAVLWDDTADGQRRLVYMAEP